MTHRYTITCTPPTGTDDVPVVFHVSAGGPREAREIAKDNLPMPCRIVSVKRTFSYGADKAEKAKARYDQSKRDAFQARQRVIARLAALKDQP